MITSASFVSVSLFVPKLQNMTNKQFLMAKYLYITGKLPILVTSEPARPFYNA